MSVPCFSRWRVVILQNPADTGTLIEDRAGLSVPIFVPGLPFPNLASSALPTSRDQYNALIVARDVATRQSALTTLAATSTFQETCVFRDDAHPGNKATAFLTAARPDTEGCGEKRKQKKQDGAKKRVINAPSLLVPTIVDSAFPYDWGEALYVARTMWPDVVCTAAPASFLDKKAASAAKRGGGKDAAAVATPPSDREAVSVSLSLVDDYNGHRVKKPPTLATFTGSCTPTGNVAFLVELPLPAIITHRLVVTATIASTGIHQTMSGCLPVAIVQGPRTLYCILHMHIAVTPENSEMVVRGCLVDVPWPSEERLCWLVANQKPPSTVGMCKHLLSPESMRAYYGLMGHCHWLVPEPTAASNTLLDAGGPAKSYLLHRQPHDVFNEDGHVCESILKVNFVGDQLTLMRLHVRWSSHSVLNAHREVQNTLVRDGWSERWQARASLSASDLQALCTKHNYALAWLNLATEPLPCPVYGISALGNIMKGLSEEVLANIVSRIVVI